MKTNIQVLDHGLIRLVSYMQPVPENKTDDWNGDLEISRNARVSYDAEGRPEDEKLINFLYANGHNTPFEAMTFTFEIKAPIFVFRQWHRHRTQSYNELSARYRELPEIFYIPELDQITTQSTDNKQMRTNEPNPNALEIQSILHRGNTRDFEEYHKLLELGCPRELARTKLPFGTYSHMFATVNLNNLFKFIAERSHAHAQYEIRVYSDALLELIEPIVPASVKAFKKEFNKGV